jgi:RecB family exonuclease
MADDTDTAYPLKSYATFERRRILLSEAGAKLVRKKTLSPSTASAVSSCGGRFAVERLLERLAPRPKDPLGAAELGTATHQVFEDLFAKPKGERGLATAAQLLERLELDHPELEAPSDPELLARWRSEVQTRVVGLWDVERPDEIEVLGREVKVTVDLNGIPFNGFIDRVHRVGDGLCVTDFKGGTGAPKRESHPRSLLSSDELG